MTYRFDRTGPRLILLAAAATPIAILIGSQARAQVVEIDRVSIPAAEVAIYVHESPPVVRVWTQALLKDGFE